MDQHTEGTMDTREIIKGKLRECFNGKIVRKDLTKKIKEGANVVYFRTRLSKIITAPNLPSKSVHRVRIIS